MIPATDVRVPKGPLVLADGSLLPVEGAAKNCASGEHRIYVTEYEYL